MYGIHVTATRFTPDRLGQTVIGMPLFFLHENVQGIVSEKHAAKIALEMLQSIADPNVQFSVTAMVVDDPL